MLVATGVVVLFAAGCGEETIDAGKVEDYLREQARVPQVIEEVTCPDGREVQEGDTFECRIELEDGGEETTTVRQVDDDGAVQVVANRQTKLPRDAARMRIIPENVEDYIRANARDLERILSVDCPADVPIERGRTFACVVRYLDRSRDVVRITQVDDLGNVKIVR